MKSGVSFPSYGATFTLATGTPDTDFPVSNLANLKDVRRVFAASGAVEITFELDAAQSLEFVGLAHHNAGVSATYRIRLYSDNLTTEVHDSTVSSFYPTPTNLEFAQSTPHRFDAVTALTGRINLSSQAWEIGGIEIGGFWLWEDVGVGREIGLKSNDAVSDQPENTQHVMRQFSPRVFKGSREVVDVTDSVTMLDFQKEKGTSRPFFWVWDTADPTTWPRECALVRNASHVPFSKMMHPSGRMGFDFLEHLA